MSDVYIIEKMVVVGIWELACDTYYFDKKTALNDCEALTRQMLTKTKLFVARVKQLKPTNSCEINKLIID